MAGSFSDTDGICFSVTVWNFLINAQVSLLKKKSMLKHFIVMAKYNEWI
jgi:hypothetical protein